MADSCRPVSRHGRYNATGPSSVTYHRESVGYGNLDYTPPDEMYTENQPEVIQRIDRPRTSRGVRSRSDIPQRPSSRRAGGRQHVELEDETFGRPASRVGFSPDASYRYSHDAYSRQGSVEAERQIPNSPCSSPDSGNHDDPYSVSPPHTYRIPADKAYRPPSSDRLTVSPSNPGLPHASQRQSPGHTYRRSPKQYPQHRSSSRDHMNVSPIQRDEPQLGEEDVRHYSGMYGQHSDPYSQEGESYQSHFTEQPRYQSPYTRESPCRESPMRNSPYNEHGAPYGTSPKYVMDSPYHRETGYPPPGSPETHRPPPVPRPKSARPKTARRKSARARQAQRHQEQETSPPQQCDNTSILNAGDPYGRPSSSLSPYKPLPGIGMMTPRSPPEGDKSHSHGLTSPLQPKVAQLSDHTEQLVLQDDRQYYPADHDGDTFTAEDIHGADMSAMDPYTTQSLPGVNMLTDLPRQMSNEIYNKSLADYEHTSHNYTDNGESDNYHRGFDDNSELTKGAEQNYDCHVTKALENLHPLPAEPSEGEEGIQLAVKLPDGQRVQRFFSPDDYLESALHFAENSSLMDYSDFCLVCSAPRKVFEDLSLTIREAGIPDRTILYLEQKE